MAKFTFEPNGAFSVEADENALLALFRLILKPFYKRNAARLLKKAMRETFKDSPNLPLVDKAIKEAEEAGMLVGPLKEQADLIRKATPTAKFRAGRLLSPEVQPRDGQKILISANAPKGRLAKKPSSKKPAVKKSAATKPTAKKPAVKKSAAVKPATKKVTKK